MCSSDLKAEGKIRAIGAANVDADHIREYLQYGELDSICINTYNKTIKITVKPERLSSQNLKPSKTVSIPQGGNICKEEKIYLKRRIIIIIERR